MIPYCSHSALSLGWGAAKLAPSSVGSLIVGAGLAVLITECVLPKLQNARKHINEAFNSQMNTLQEQLANNYDQPVFDRNITNLNWTVLPNDPEQPLPPDSTPGSSSAQTAEELQQWAQNLAEGRARLLRSPEVAQKILFFPTAGILKENPSPSNDELVHQAQALFMKWHSPHWSRVKDFKSLWVGVALTVGIAAAGVLFATIPGGRMFKAAAALSGGFLITICTLFPIGMHAEQEV